jgi:hypothetical protein
MNDRVIMTAIDRITAAYKDGEQLIKSIRHFFRPERSFKSRRDHALVWNLSCEWFFYVGSWE